MARLLFSFSFFHSELFSTSLATSALLCFSIRLARRGPRDRLSSFLGMERAETERKEGRCDAEERESLRGWSFFSFPMVALSFVASLLLPFFTLTLLLRLPVARRWRRPARRRRGVPGHDLERGGRGRERGRAEDEERSASAKKRASSRRVGKVDVLTSLSLSLSLFDF